MNKFAKQLIVALAISTAVGVPIAIVSSQGSGPASPAPFFTPAQLANGLAFNQGPAASYLTAFDRPQVPLTGKLPTVERSLDASLRANPMLARRFARDAQSGNGAKVRVALGILGSLTRGAFDRVFGRGGDQRMIEWARQGPKDVDINPAADEQGTLCPDCDQNTPPPITVSPSPTPTKPWLTCTFPVCLPWPPPWTPAPTPSPTITYPQHCSTCIQNTPPPTVTAPYSPPPTEDAQLALAVPPGVAFSLPWFMTGPHRSARVSRKDMAETIAVVAFSLDAD
jgi:hypothetical protein